MNLLKYALQECHLFLISLQLYYGLDLSFSQNNKVLVAVVSGFRGWDFFVALCFKPFMCAVGPAVIGRVWLEELETMAQELQVGPKVQKERSELCPSCGDFRCVQHAQVRPTPDCMGMAGSWGMLGK